MNSLSFFVAMLISLATLTFCNLKGFFTMRVIMKIVSSFLFLCIAYAAKKENEHIVSKKYFNLIFLGLFFAFWGDTFLVLAEGHGILLILGVLCFMLTHIFYTYAYLQHGAFTKSDVLYAICFFVPLLCLSLLPYFDFRGLKPVVYIYGIIISTMAGKSLSLRKFKKENPYFVSCTIAASLLMLISDALLLFAIFGGSSYWYMSAVNNVLYYIGQGLYGLSFRKRNPSALVP